ncbi:LysM peptidoglycan-binding domain-containing protein [Bifidobacterium biavatii]|uniref:Peptidoglycan-binding LysM n=1 Tax=Bifidobacterium biavatii DSM 23969 TaxID=1437608 RepID=A0A087A563_9BIFI|nr:LysM peptidoglycan-binding domain-containing protein [Bifidobacterium biavatii]KFI53913.1 Peptidoglycan-binding LysM [Bifidobacterium biavatii DSM 23969]
MNAIAGTAGAVGRGSRAESRVSKLLQTVAAFGLCVMMASAVLLTVMPSNPRSLSASETTSYTVRPGDTLWSYAERITPQGGDVAENVELIMRLNHMDDTQIEPGQQIRVPKE